jgi:hypothetical protein
MVTPALGPSLGTNSGMEVLGQPEHLLPRADVAERGLCRLLHAFFQEPGDDELPIARDDARFALQDRAAVGRVRQAIRQADLVVLAGLVRAEARGAEVLGNVLGRDAVLRLELVLLAVAQDLPRELAADGADLAFEVSDAALLRVVMNHGSERVLADVDVQRALVGADEARFDLLPGHQVSNGDVQLLELGVAAEIDDLHAVA